MADVPIYRKDLKFLADLRAKEAGVLLADGKSHGAYYLAGYAVKCALKACIAKKTKKFEFPAKPDYVREVYSHKLNTLVSVAGLDADLKKEINTNPAFATNWSTVKEWTEESRYKTEKLNGRDMYNAIVGADGVLPWIKQRW